MSGRHGRRHDLVPDGFVERYGADDVADALEAAKREESSTDHDQLPRCPHCGAIRVIPKVSWRNHPNQKPGEYKCSTCLEHFDQPAPPRAESDHGGDI